MPQRLTRIDILTRSDHQFLEKGDACYFLGEYTARQDFTYSPTNDLISNFKKGLEYRGAAAWSHKLRAIQTVADAFRVAVPQRWCDLATFVPIPPSKVKDDPLYDDRLVEMLDAIRPGRPLDVRELLFQTRSTPAAHTSGRRLLPDELEALYCIDESLTLPVPRAIAIVDDMVTNGAHFRAAERVLTARLPNVEIGGVFITRRI